MDRSVDSIGSCSLDVDADSFSETSGSVNFTTPLPEKDFTRVFTSNIRERCEEQDTELSNNLNSNYSPNWNTKKPSYLSLACCVNGYSNLTTYDSKVRQEINKSREVSPIRPSTSSIECCKKSSSLVVPSCIIESVSTVPDDKYKIDKIINFSEKNDELKNRSFIQQRVERLYGANALTQGFYCPKTIKSKYCKEKNIENTYKSSEKFSSNSDCLETVLNNNSVDLPVLRHLSREFRAQLPTISPKKSLANITKNANKSNSEAKTEVEENGLNSCHVTYDEVDRKMDTNITDSLKNQDLIISNLENQFQNKNSSAKKDGNYFLFVLKQEQNRLLCLAHEAEKCIDILSQNTEVNEEALGLLRLAAGKARLLVTQKMKQFEGLCHKNLTISPDEKFPTTNEDLEGFWDMVQLQVKHIDSIFQEIETCKANNWKKTDIEIPTVVLTKITKPPKYEMKTSAFISSKPIMSSKLLRREAQRKELIELKRKQKLAMSAKLENGSLDSDATEILVNKNS